MLLLCFYSLDRSTLHSGCSFLSWYYLYCLSVLLKVFLLVRHNCYDLLAPSIESCTCLYRPRIACRLFRLDTRTCLFGADTFIETYSHTHLPPVLDTPTYSHAHIWTHTRLVTHIPRVKERRTDVLPPPTLPSLLPSSPSLSLSTSLPPPLSHTHCRHVRS